MNIDNLEAAISGAHKICNKRLVFETVDMAENDVLVFLINNSITSKVLQSRYLKCLEIYRGIMEE